MTSRRCSVNAVRRERIEVFLDLKCSLEINCGNISVLLNRNTIWISDKLMILDELLTFAIQCSIGTKRFFNRPCKTDFAVGLWTSCNTKRCDCKKRENLVKQ